MYRTTCLFATLLLFVLSAPVFAQTGQMIDVGPHDRTYTASAHTRGFWFTAPTDFDITELRVPNAAGSHPQYIEVLRYYPGEVPATWSSTSNDFYSLGRFTSVPNGDFVDVDISVREGDVIGVLGAQWDGSQMRNSYGPTNTVNSTILGESVTLSRLGFQGALSQTAAHDVWTENSTFCRVEVYIEVKNNLDIRLVHTNSRENVGPHDHGSTGDGVVLAEFDLQTGTDAFDVQEISFEISGSGDPDAAFDEVAVYEDTGSGVFQGSGVDMLAAPVGTFSNGEYTAVLNSPSMAADSRRVFYLVGKLNGTAANGDTFDVEVTDLVATTSGSGVTYGAPSPEPVLGVEVGAGRLTAALSPNTPPAGRTFPAGNAEQHVLSAFVFANSSANAEEITEITLTTSGTGDFATDTSNIALWHDMTGDGEFDPSSDIFLGDVASGASPLSVPFASPLDLDPGDVETVLAVVSFNAGHPGGATYGLLIDDENDVTASTTVEFGTLAPTGHELEMIDFAITSFTPLIDAPAGGEDIVIDGEGFSLPVEVRIGGVVCPGTPQVNGAGTEITGLSVPENVEFGVAHVIELDIGTLPTQTLSETFLYDFEITAISPMTSTLGGGEELVIEGRGFALPVEVRIGGVVCEGDAVVSPDGTQITGLFVPQSDTSGEVIIELDISVVPTQEFAQPFRYGSISVGSRGCGTVLAPLRGGARWLLGVWLAALAVAVVLRRRRSVSAAHC